MCLVSVCVCVCVCVCLCLCLCLCLSVCTCLFSNHSVMSNSVTRWTVALQAPLSTGFSRQEYWSELLFPLSGNLPNPGIKPMFPASPVLAGGFFTT